MLLGFDIRKKVKKKKTKNKPKTKLDRYDLEVTEIQYAENRGLVRLFCKVIFGVQAREEHCIHPKEINQCCPAHSNKQYSVLLLLSKNGNVSLRLAYSFKV